MIEKITSEILNTDPTLFLIAWIIAALIVLVIYLVIVRNVMNKINAKVANSPEIDEVPNKPGVYFISIAFWPAALIIGNNYLAKPETARTGRVCIIIFLWFSGFIVLLSITTVYLAFIYLPEIIEFLKEFGLW